MTRRAQSLRALLDHVPHTTVIARDLSMRVRGVGRSQPLDNFPAGAFRRSLSLDSTSPVRRTAPFPTLPRHCARVARALHYFSTLRARRVVTTHRAVFREAASRSNRPSFGRASVVARRRRTPPRAPDRACICCGRTTRHSSVCRSSFLPLGIDRRFGALQTFRHELLRVFRLYAEMVRDLVHCPPFEIPKAQNFLAARRKTF